VSRAAANEVALKSHTGGRDYGARAEAMLRKQLLVDLGSLGTPAGAGGATGVVGFAKGAGQGVAADVKGLYETARHPIIAGKNIATFVGRPYDEVEKDVADAVHDGINNNLYRGAEGQGRAVYAAASFIGVPQSVGGKVAATAGKLVKLDRAAELARANALVRALEQTAERRTIIVTPKGVAVAGETLAKQGMSHVAGNFTGLAGRSVEDIIARVPSEWKMVPQDMGMGIKFLDEAGFERIRIHGPTKAPAGSNAASGWTLRVMDRAGNYFDDAGRIVPYKANSGHIPIYGNPKAP
jgi:hypothetical protein